MPPPEHIEVEEAKCHRKAMEQEEEKKEEVEEKKECIHNVRLQETKQEERRRKGEEEEEDEVPGAGEEKDVCSRRPDGAAIDSMKKTLYSLELTHTTH